jgi:hypothetical protein
MKLHLAATAVLTTVVSLSIASGATGAETVVAREGQRATTMARPVPAPAPKAGTAVTIGSTTLPPGNTCGPTLTAVQGASAGAPYTVPGAGILTSYSYYARAAPGNVRAVVFTPAPAAGHWTLVGKTAFTPVTMSSLNTFPTRIPVPAGATLGLGVSTGTMDCGVPTGNPGDLFNYQVGFDADAQTDLNSAFQAGVRANISAVWEPDADGDLFGDVSQDLCPQSRLTQAACPAPDTSVKKPKLLASGKVKITLTSTIAGSTFTCAIDGKAAKPCRSPIKKRFSFGKHKIVVTATSPLGIADPSPFKGKFRLVRR